MSSRGALTRASSPLFESYPLTVQPGLGSGGQTGQLRPGNHVPEEQVRALRTTCSEDHLRKASPSELPWGQGGTYREDTFKKAL